MPANGAGAVKATAGRWRSYSVLITEELSTRAVPEPLVDVLSVEQYQQLFGEIKREYERTRFVGTRLLKFATHFPCVVLFMVPLLMRRMARLDAELNARLQALCDAASTEHQQRVRFNVRQLGGVASSRGGRQAHQIWIDLQFADQEGRVGGDLYVLQPPAVPSEAPPPQENPPEVSSEEDDAEEIEQQPTLTGRLLRFGSRPRRKQDMPPAIALAAVNTVTP